MRKRAHQQIYISIFNSERLQIWTPFVDFVNNRIAHVIVITIRAQQHESYQTLWQRLTNWHQIQIFAGNGKRSQVRKSFKSTSKVTTVSIESSELESFHLRTWKQHLMQETPMDTVEQCVAKMLKVNSLVSNRECNVRQLETSAEMWSAFQILVQSRFLKGATNARSINHSTGESKAQT